MYRFDEQVAELLREVYFGIRNSLGEAYNFGLKDGHSLLHELAAGNLSIQDFNEKTLARDR